ncbi:hypothetical protein PISMIDRAFT_9714 [Pisolithus microcarpus 441]|uniref:Uncharacterized protein n=1 Tax=Pisolithus microcarpus 441 TaxID=765257 RepID=A0A0C9ZZY6_9AGAM|nr:hypothetical protein PISMIDRAFT_9714 [Pisolithus microcarpus 441]
MLSTSILHTLRRSTSGNFLATTMGKLMCVALGFSSSRGIARNKAFWHDEDHELLFTALSDFSALVVASRHELSMPKYTQNVVNNFDSLCNSPASVFANGDTDHCNPTMADRDDLPEPNLPIPTLCHASPSTPRIVDSDKTFAKEPKIYGPSEPSLISLEIMVGSNGMKFKK